jgi:hypothetical protein
MKGTNKMFDFLFNIIVQLVQWEAIVLVLLILTAIWLVIALFLLGFTLEMIQKRKIRKQHKKEIALL